MSHHLKTRILVGRKHPEEDWLLRMGLVLILIIGIVPRLIFPIWAIPIQPMIAEFGLIALKIRHIAPALCRLAAVVSLVQYNQLEAGMHLLEVEEIMGRIGIQVRTPAAQTDSTAVTYEWTNPDGSRMRATFQNMKLVNKAQNALPAVHSPAHSGLALCQPPATPSR
jgi:hypothetical protein